MEFRRRMKNQIIHPSFFAANRYSTVYNEVALKLAVGIQPNRELQSGLVKSLKE